MQEGLWRPEVRRDRDSLRFGLSEPRAHCLRPAAGNEDRRCSHPHRYGNFRRHYHCEPAHHGVDPAGCDVLPLSGPLGHAIRASVDDTVYSAPCDTLTLGPSFVVAIAVVDGFAIAHILQRHSRHAIFFDAVRVIRAPFPRGVIIIDRTVYERPVCGNFCYLLRVMFASLVAAAHLESASTAQR